MHLLDFVEKKIWCYGWRLAVEEVHSAQNGPMIYEEPWRWAGVTS